MHEEEALEAQQDLVEQSLDLVFTTYDEAISAKVESPVVLVVDCQDQLGGQIAQGWLGEEAVYEAILLHQSEQEGEDQEEPFPDTPVAFARALAWKECRDELVGAFPYLAEVLQATPPEDGVLVISITAGGASALTAPFSAR